MKKERWKMAKYVKKPVVDESEGGTHEHVWPRKIVH
nr:MAG TPA: hypothetical protein [Caudoviricetes sp.]